MFCNLALLATLTALLYYALRQIGRRWAATAACLVFVLLFAFGQYMWVGNFNYVCPYSHEMTHGLMLSLLAVVVAWPSERGGLLRWVASGLALGLAFLTKAEVFLPGAAATAVVLLLRLWFERPGWGGSGEGLLLFGRLSHPTGIALLLWRCHAGTAGAVGTLERGLAVCTGRNRQVAVLPLGTWDRLPRGRTPGPCSP